MSVNDYVDRFLGWRHYVLFILILGSIAILLTSQITLRDFPNSGDEYSYLISAQLFSVGKLSVPSPQHMEFFHFFHIINDGKFYGKYPFGWPFFLMFGVLLGFPAISNLAFGVLTLAVVYLIAREVFTERVARIALLLMATSSYFIFNSASYFSHPSSLFFSSLFAYVYLKNLKKERGRNWLLLGILAGISFNIRYLDAFAVVSAFALHYVFTAVKGKKPIQGISRDFILFLVGFSILFSVFISYNYLQTGDPFLTPFGLYERSVDTGAFTIRPILTIIDICLFRRLLSLNLWVPLCILFMYIALAEGKKREMGCLLLTVFCFMVFAYMVYSMYLGNEYGPRYLYSASFAVFVLMAAGIERLKGKGFGWVLWAVILANLVLFAHFSLIFNDMVNGRMGVYDAVKERGISNALVFLASPSGSMHPLDLTRNGIGFNGSVLYVHYIRGQNHLIMQDYPDREYYIWVDYAWGDGLSEFGLNQTAS